MKAERDTTGTFKSQRQLKRYQHTLSATDWLAKLRECVHENINAAQTCTNKVLGTTCARVTCTRACFQHMEDSSRQGLIKALGFFST